MLRHVFVLNEVFEGSYKGPIKDLTATATATAGLGFKV